MKKTDSSDITYNGGIITVGSLIWDLHPLREKWRNNYLELSDKVLVKMPIRYGHIAESRSFTYTIVFSSECQQPEKLGKGYFVPFKKRALCMEEIVFLSNQMINAERNSNENTDLFYWDWGCLGLAVNPILSGSDKYNMLIKKWSNYFNDGFNRAAYNYSSEPPIISSEGILNIRWPDELKDMDFYICTPTTLNAPAYPSSVEIASRMQESNYSDYFLFNVNSGIVTFQDKEIAKFL